ncbi:Histidinol-phosphatase [Limihaloglobus sulfuriphilus]|uniref:Histidinol-phosphatase n=1 Tax=Limihaloglobus sulfuriphilus TaxID=1851148 RepID=A0A1Q2MI13_9BACT|nr:histidinol-phosphatase [Limihaloglobus sulfuriphilus]AQQ71937.1 Histidinol-phosphatase [Limihaloglobus sulfuriphilus]
MSGFDKDILKQNLHTHTSLCKHAEGSVRDYCAAALNSGIEVLGISDHNPMPGDRWISIRMSQDQLCGYAEAIEDARKEFAPEMRVIAGLECDYVPEYLDFYRRKFLDEYGFEYLIGGLHLFYHAGQWQSCYLALDSRAALRAYTEQYVEMLGNDMFAFAAHPDLFAFGWFEWDNYTIGCAREILTAAQESGKPLEINGFGTIKNMVDDPAGPRPPYPLPQFWQLAAEYDITAVINSDAHSPDNITAGMTDCLDIAQKYGLRRAKLEDMIKPADEQNSL